MYLTDFIYDGIQLSNFGCIVGSFATSYEDSADIGSNINLETINYNSYLSGIVNASYDGVISCTFDIIKSTCFNGFKDYMEDNEISFFMNWLNRKEYCKFTPIYNHDEFYDTYYYGTFTEIKAIKTSGKVIGLTLTFTANAPFGFKETKDNLFVISSPNGTFDIYNNSDERGILYPTAFKVTCTNNGLLRIYNYTEYDSGRYTEIKNCIAGEIITLDCIHKIITSNMSHSSLYNDFNYVFPRLYNDKNTFILSIPCTVHIDYEPIRKVGIIV